MDKKFETLADMPRSLQCKYDIISNFILYWTSDDIETKRMISALADYMNEDDFNEVEGYFPITIEL